MCPFQVFPFQTWHFSDSSFPELSFFRCFLSELSFCSFYFSELPFFRYPFQSCPFFLFSFSHLSSFSFVIFEILPFQNCPFNSFWSICFRIFRLHEFVMARFFDEQRLERLITPGARHMKAKADCVEAVLWELHGNTGHRNWWNADQARKAWGEPNRGTLDYGKAGRGINTYPKVIWCFWVFSAN